MPIIYCNLKMGLYNQAITIIDGDKNYRVSYARINLLLQEIETISREIGTKDVMISGNDDYTQHFKELLIKKGYNIIKENKREN